MDKVITALIIVLVAGFFYWLYAQGESSASQWEAMVGTGDEAHSAGMFPSYEACIEGVSSMVDVSTTVYSCSQR